MRGHELLRASDADRDAVIDSLREAACEGRLEADELEQRVDAALRARTYGELGELLTDLPGDTRVLWRPAGSRANPVARYAMLGAGLLVAVTLALAIVALVAMLVLATAAWWIALVLFWLVCRSTRRRLVSGPARRRSPRTRHAHSARPSSLL
jgi:Flp pilus assembly protein TadB